ncbi:MAG: imidazole glycerol phosphate synthase subunit HisH [Bacillota bacterium]|nr:imidazole glycerol phosphate synthase subunit HisH [Bacillota bacterium]
MIAIIDYGMGNLRNVERAFRRLGIPAVVTGDRREVEKASALVLPGVGAFTAAMENLRRAGLEVVIREAVEGGRPFLGICLGLQLLFEESEEGAEGGARPRGLGLLPGRVVRFKEGLKVPQIGWNQLHILRPEAPELQGIEEGSFFYFVHSYYALPADPGTVAATTDYGVSFASAVWRDNLFAVQFHPEKSSRAGLTLLANFARRAGLRVQEEGEACR